jgi:sister chromatid cohesion protein DCC1
MATQYTTDIPFSASQEQQPFKLLELPPELLALFESDNPPMYHVPSLLAERGLTPCTDLG